MSALVLIGCVALFFVIGMPIAFAIGLASLCAIYVVPGLTPIVVPQKLFTSNDSFALMAIPFFILAGSLMMRGGLSSRLVALAEALVGKFPGGLALVGVLGSLFFGAISGSPVATVAAVGGLIIPAMISKGYAPGFAGAVHAAAGPLGAMIPPSVILIIYGVIAQQNISTLFLATVVPGVLMGIALMLVGGFIAWRRGYSGSSEHLPLGQLCVKSFWALLMPVIILGGIYGGVFTPTEAAVVAVAYALIVGLFIYRELTLPTILETLVESAIATAIVMIIMDFAGLFGWMLTTNRIPVLFAQFILSLSDNPVYILIGINLIMLVSGMFMDPASAIVILTPVFQPLAAQLQLDPIHFGIVTCTNLLIGNVTPPVGITMFVASRIAQCKVDYVIGEIWPFLGAMLLVLLLVNVFPIISLCLL